MKILITGALGQLGNELKDTSAHYPILNITYTDYQTLDITDEGQLNEIFATHKFDYCINCAAYTAVDKAETDIDNAFKINALAAELLGKVTAKYGAKLIQISTDFVFDGTLSRPYKEEDATHPLSVYGQSKLDGEIKSLAANANTLIIRTAWLYSFYGNNFVKTMRRFGKERESLNVIYDQVGAPTYAYDLAKAVWHIISLGNEGFKPGVYHYSNLGVASWFDFATSVMEISKLPCKVHPIITSEYPTPATRPSYCILDKRKIKDTFGVEIPYWRDSLKQCIALLEAHDAKH